MGTSASPQRLGLRWLALCFAASPAAAFAQFNDTWLEVEPEPGRLDLIEPLTSSQTQVRFAWGDLNLNGWTDLVAVRRPVFTLLGKRTNVLLMNENGVLVDRTAAYASQATGVPTFDLGFLTATSDQDVILIDVDGDGWLDVVTAVDLSSGDPKHLSHPRVYRNLGENQAGVWLGLQFENARIPQLLGADGLPASPNFGAVAGGDITGNGFADLYFGNHADAGGSGQSGLGAFGDRLLANTGGGFFVDESTLRMQPGMLASGYNFAVEVADLNGSGLLDVTKVSFAVPPLHVSSAYNDPSNPGFFQLFDAVLPPYEATSVTLADLNGDGRLDQVLPGTSLDRYRLNQGTDALGRVIWGSWTAPQFLVSPTIAFSGRARAADLDGSGRADVLIPDVFVAIPSFSGRMQVLHNRGGAIGGATELREERETADSSGWIGAKGLFLEDLRRVYDVAIFDIDNDGDLDLVIAQRDQVVPWMNRTDPVFCQTDLGFAGPGAASLSLCGQPLWFGNQATLRIENATPGAPWALAVGVTQGALPLLGGTLVPVPWELLFTNLLVGPTGSSALPLTSPGSGPDLFFQAVVFDPTLPEGLQLTNAIRGEFP